MSQTAAQPATPPMPVQLAESECTALLLPHLSLPQRGPKCQLGYHRLVHLILWVLDTGMQWKGFPVPPDTNGTPAIHDTTVYRAFATWADAGSLWQAFVARGRHLTAEKQRDLRMLHGAGPTTVVKKGGLALGARGINTSRGIPSSRASPPRARSERLSRWLPSMKRLWCPSPGWARLDAGGQAGGSGRERRLSPPRGWL